MRLSPLFMRMANTNFPFYFGLSSLDNFPIFAENIFKT